MSSFLSVHDTSSFPAIGAASQVTFSSVLLTPTVVNSTVSQFITPMPSSSGSPTVVTMTTKSMESFSSKPARTSSLQQLTSSPALSLPLLVSLSLKSSPALTSTVSDSASTSSVFSSSVTSPPAAIIIPCKIGTGISPGSCRDSRRGGPFSRRDPSWEKFPPRISARIPPRNLYLPRDPAKKKTLLQDPGENPAGKQNFAART